MSNKREHTNTNDSKDNLDLTRREVLKGAVLSVASLAGAAAVPAQAAAQQQSPVELPAVGPPAGRRGHSFRFDSSITKVQVWGVRGNVYPRAYFQEFLPALVDRTLVFDDFTLGSEGTLSWIFTGPRGGFTVQFKPGEISLTQRYYDSPGLAPLLQHPPATRFPESISDSSTARFRGRVQSVRVTLDSQLGLHLYVNGRRIFQQTCVLDVERHQLAYSGNNPAMRGALIEPEVKEATVRVHSDRKRQTMLGFGGTTTPPAYVLLSPEGKRRWWELLCEYNLLLHLSNDVPATNAGKAAAHRRQ